MLVLRMKDGLVMGTTIGKLMISLDAYLADKEGLTYSVKQAEWSMYIYKDGEPVDLLPIEETAVILTGALCDKAVTV